MKAATVSYQCGLCPKEHTAPADTALALLQLCPECLERRRAKGLEAQRLAEQGGQR